MRILSIQSSVAYGHVGNSAAVFPLQRLGHEVWPVLTVHFSNHTGYGDWRGPLLAPADVADVIAGIGERGVLGSCDAVLSGYQGDPAMGAVILDAVAAREGGQPGGGLLLRPGDGRRRARDVRPAGDPGVHARRGGAARRHHHAQPLRARLPDRPDHDHARRGAGGRGRRPRARAARRAGHLGAAGRPGSRTPSTCIAVSDAGAWAVTTPMLAISPNGGGDVTAALYLAHLLETGSPAAALARTTSSVFGDPRGDAGGRRPRAPAGRRPGRHRRPRRAVRGAPGPLTVESGSCGRPFRVGRSSMWFLTSDQTSVSSRSVEAATGSATGCSSPSCSPPSRSIAGRRRSSQAGSHQAR